ncbi:MAG TPA: HAMP domain-containing sensor histidine kinase [Ktedonobacterales bacterium]|nr:HAMP domain-containing sensor histidine kinase [Ktedonobacterales bacterium]
MASSTSAPRDRAPHRRARPANTHDAAPTIGNGPRADLLGTLSHELRSPLTAIKGYAATVLRYENRLPREERHEYLRAIIEASDRLEVIIDRLLRLSELEAGDVVLQREPTDIARVALDAIDAIKRRLREAGAVRYHFRVRVGDGDEAFPGQLPLVSADPRLLRLALDNLLENAAKYSPMGGEIDVSLRINADTNDVAPGDVESRPAPMLEVAIRDTGLGISLEHLDRVFERFHRVDVQLTRQVNGLGLGLAICSRIAELHGGSIWAESGPGMGSVFYLTLPVAARDSGDGGPD